MSKDQALGWLIFIVCIVLAVGYVVLLFVPSLVSGAIGVSVENIRFWAVGILVLLAFLAVVFIGGWIGWTLATTPPPKPLEDLESELGKEQENAEAQREEAATSDTGKE